MRYQGGKSRIAAQIAPFILGEGGIALLACFAALVRLKAALRRISSGLS